jgi:hypothetical protein
MVRYSFVCRRHLFGVSITSRTGERVSARPKFLAHHSFHPQSWINYIVWGCPAEHFMPLLDGIVHLFYLWFLLLILRHPCCLYYSKQWICAFLSMFYVCFYSGLNDSTFFKWQSLVNDDGATMMMHRWHHPYPTMTTRIAAKSIQNENNNKTPSIWPASISQLAWGSDAWLEGGQSISDCL